MNAFGKTALAALLALGGLLAANVATADTELDFTNNVWLDGSEAVNIGSTSVAVTLSSSPANSLSFENDSTQTGNTVSFVGGGRLAENFDGIGVTDDEVGGSETLFVKFSESVVVTGASFLDLFAAASGDAETISLRFFNNGLEAPVSPITFTGTSVFPANGGWFSATFNGVVADEVRVVFVGGNDGQGIGDAALAALRVQAVPIPAAAWLFGSALLGIAGIGYRKRKSQA